MENKYITVAYKLYVTENGKQEMIEEAMVREWEKQTGNLVYHVIKSQMIFGLCYSFLYVSADIDEWQWDMYRDYINGTREIVEINAAFVEE